jgi:hypothetical protein
MLSKSRKFVLPASESERAYLESLIRADYEHCHPGEALEDMKRRASFSKGISGFTTIGLRSRRRAAVERLASPQLVAAE